MFNNFHYYKICIANFCLPILPALIFLHSTAFKNIFQQLFHSMYHSSFKFVQLIDRWSSDLQKVITTFFFCSN